MHEKTYCGLEKQRRTVELQNPPSFAAARKFRLRFRYQHPGQYGSIWVSMGQWKPSGMTISAAF